MGELAVCEVLAGELQEKLFVDPAWGPKVLLVDGSVGFMQLKPLPPGKRDSVLGPYHERDTRHACKMWSQMTSTEQSVMLQLAAKKNRKMREWKGAAFWEEALAELGAAGAAAGGEGAAPGAIGPEEQERLAARCARELARPALSWVPISTETVAAGHDKRAPGMLYGLEFPWTEDMLAEFGPAWLTRALHAAGTLERSNAVTKIEMEKKTKVTTGNNGGKFLFEVRYAKRVPGMHTKLFAKVPFPLEGATKSDRLSSSVYKQPQELYELNTYRLLEASLPMRTPKFYYGDISNATSNWILITECVAFADHDGVNFGRPTAGKRKQALKAFQIEGPYDKCIDYNLRGPASEYYMLLVQTGAKMAGLYRAGRLGSPVALAESFGRPRGDPASPAGWGLNSERPTGEAPNMLKAKLDAAIRFLSDTGKVLFPAYAAGPDFHQRLRTSMLTLNAYKAEIDYWKHSDTDYTALVHSNLNVDNAYFWRDQDGKLDCGIFDWGAMGAGCVGHKLWWWLYCSDYDVFRGNLSKFIDAFVVTYHEFGGPVLDRKVLEMKVIITAMEQMIGLISAVPQILRMCPAGNWRTITDRYDPRVAENIDGKSTLRLYLHVMGTIIQVMEEMGGHQVLQSWIQDVWVGQLGHTAKAQAAIFGAG